MTTNPRFRGAVGTVTPSGNVVVEQVTIAILAAFPEISPHFSRTPVFGDADPFPDSYDWNGMLGAARLLAHARPDVIVWNGSKGATIGFATDDEFCRRVTEETGIPATTSTVALRFALDTLHLRRIALVTPYVDGYQGKLIAGFEREGLRVVAEAHSGIADNLAIASVPGMAIEDMARRVAASSPDAVLTWCTNFPAAYVVRSLERELGIPVLDSVTLAVWHALRIMGLGTSRGHSWGSLFEIGRNEAPSWNA